MSKNWQRETTEITKMNHEKVKSSLTLRQVELKQAFTKRVKNKEMKQLPILKE